MANPAEFFERKIYKVKDPCENPIMLMWVNSLGGVDRWLFSYKQTASINYESGDVYEVYFFDLETTIKSLGKRKSDFSVTFQLSTDSLTKNELMAIQEIKSSPSVYAMKQDGSFLGVVSSQMNTTYNRTNFLHSASFEITFPRNFNPERWLED